MTRGCVTLDGVDVLAMSVDERARAGLFLAMQYPVEVPGVSVSNFLRTAKTAIDGEAPKLRTWVKDVNTAMAAMKMDPAFATRSVNEGFSGGEKKRHEILQLELLNPLFAVLDETDSGLDIDALKVVAEGVNRYRAKGDRGVLLITHYTRILRYITPDFVHVFVDGRIAEEGGPELADRLEAEGYDRFTKAHRLSMTVDDPPPARRRLPARRPGPDPGGLPDPGSRRWPTGTHWSTWTARTPRRSRRSSSTRWWTTSSGTTPTSPGPCTSWAPSRPRASRAAGTRWRRSSTRPRATRWCSPRTRPRRSTWWRTPWPGRAGPLQVGEGDEVLITEMEHHSNIVPWQLLTERTGRDGCAGSGSPTTAGSTSRTSTS